FHHYQDLHGKAFVAAEQNALLFIDVLRSCVVAGEFKLHDFVVMPNHVHLLIEVNHAMTIEKAMQLIKGRFSYRLKKECGYGGEVRQRGFSDGRIKDEQSFLKHREYIGQNPVKAGLVDSAEKYPVIPTWQRKKRRG
ncbi:MAG TPA: transposase, partial [Pseudacidobacterium sp.]|nr:transposase [Pseudacidobacterium sp.]